ncbi:MAG: sigma-70 family RNA polymerase sigma factor [Myxococcota bacterium]
MSQKRAFERIALPHLPALHRMAVRLCRNGDDANDLVQDGLVKAFRFFHRFEEGSNARAWLFKVMVNIFYNRYHKAARDRRLAEDVVADDRFDRFVSAASLAPTRDPEQALVERLSGAGLRRALENLPVDFRAAVLLCDVEGLSYREIADVLECPIGTVMSRIYRGRRALRQALAGDVPTASQATAGAVDLDDYRRWREGAAPRPKGRVES